MNKYIQELKQEKEKLENDILKLIQEFQDKHDLIIDRIEHIHQYYTTNDLKKMRTHESITIKINLDLE